MLSYIYYFINGEITTEMLLHNIYIVLFIYTTIKLLLEFVRGLIGYGR